MAAARQSTSGPGRSPALDEVNKAVIAATPAVYGRFVGCRRRGQWKENAMNATRNAIRRIGISVAIARWAWRAKRPT